jgi:hypothetical protein
MSPTDFGVVELLPAREEMGRRGGGGGNVVAIGAIIQVNANLQIGFVNVNNQSNSVVIVQR